MSAPVRPAQISSWSAAAAWKVSPAHISTFSPGPQSCLASLPMVVVFPPPLTPMTSTTEGRVPRRRRVSPIQHLHQNVFEGRSLASSGSPRFFLPGPGCAGLPPLFRRSPHPGLPGSDTPPARRKTRRPDWKSRKTHCPGSRPWLFWFWSRPSLILLKKSHCFSPQF